MIKTDDEYLKTLNHVNILQKYIDEQCQSLQSFGLTDEQIEAAMQPISTYHQSLAEDVKTFERIKRGEGFIETNLSKIGILLISIRIFRGWTQKRLADALGVSEAQVSKDERNEYHNVSVNKAQRILDAMGSRLKITVELEM